MAKEFQNKYRIASACTYWWNCSWNDACFITICTHNRECFFGEIVQSQFIASPSGQIAETIWHEIPTQFPYAESGNFMVTPNHIYRILILNKPLDNIRNNNDTTIVCVVVVETQLIASLQQQHRQKNHHKLNPVDLQEIKILN